MRAMLLRACPGAPEFSRRDLPREGIAQRDYLMLIGMTTGSE